MMKAPRPLVYFAAPLFNDADRRFNKTVVRNLEKFVDVFLPQRDGGLLFQKIKEGFTPEAAEKFVFRCDVDAMQRASFLIAVLDGSTVDDGVAFEIGYMHCLGRPCFGLQTDIRRALPTGNNPMIGGALADVFLTVKALCSFVSSMDTYSDAITSNSARNANAPSRHLASG